MQIKKHKGVTGDEAVKQLLKIMANDASADGCVMSLAEEFSDAAQELSDQNGIALMNGPAICELVLGALAANTAV